MPSPAVLDGHSVEGRSAALTSSGTSAPLADGSIAASPLASRNRAAVAAMVGAWNSTESGNSTPCCLRIRLNSRIAISDCPPSSKKSSSIEIC